METEIDEAAQELCRKPHKLIQFQLKIAAHLTQFWIMKMDDENNENYANTKEDEPGMSSAFHFNKKKLERQRGKTTTSGEIKL